MQLTRECAFSPLLLARYEVLRQQQQQQQQQQHLFNDLFQGNACKPILERQTILAFNEPKDDKVAVASALASFKSRMVIITF